MNIDSPSLSLSFSVTPLKDASNAAISPLLVLGVAPTSGSAVDSESEPVTSLKTTFIFPPVDGTTNILSPAGTSVFFGDGKNTRDFIHVDDLIDGIIQSISNIKGKKGNVYNLASGVSTSVKELAELMISISKKDLELIFMEPRPGDLLHSLASIKLAKEELGFEPKILLKDGLSILMKE